MPSQKPKPNAASKQKQPYGVSRYGRPAAIGTLSAKISTPIWDKRGFASGAIIGRWAEIVGAELSAYAVPLEIKFPRNRNDKATLLLQVANGAAAMQLQLKTPVLIERINGFLGYAAVTRVEAHQGPLPRRPKPKNSPEPTLNADEQTQIEQKIKNVVSSDLRVALQKLGAAIARRSHDGTKH